MACFTHLLNLLDDFYEHSRYNYLHPLFPEAINDEYQRPLFYKIHIFLLFLEL